MYLGLMVLAFLPALVGIGFAVEAFDEDEDE